MKTLIFFITTSSPHVKWSSKELLFELYEKFGSDYNILQSFSDHITASICKRIYDLQQNRNNLNDISQNPQTKFKVESQNSTEQEEITKIINNSSNPREKLYSFYNINRIRYATQF